MRILASAQMAPLDGDDNHDGDSRHNDNDDDQVCFYDDDGDNACRDNDDAGRMMMEGIRVLRMTMRMMLTNLTKMCTMRTN